MKYDIHDIQLFAALHGGKCLSKVYLDKYSTMSWMCKRGHTWDACYNTVYRGSWCKQCIRYEVQDCFLQEIKDIALSKNGVCLSDVYINNHTHLLFRCKNGHEWLAKSNNIKSGWWCAHCSGNAKLNIEEFKDIAKSYGGKCLSKVYVNVHSKLLWQCAKGHEWESSGNSVKSLKQWCPQCSNRKRWTTEDMKRVAEEKGGKFLSKRYEASAKMKWRCKFGHIWYTTANKIRRGHWCQYCGKYKIK